MATKTMPVKRPVRKLKPHAAAFDGAGRSKTPMTARKASSHGRQWLPEVLPLTQVHSGQISEGHWTTAAGVVYRAASTEKSITAAVSGSNIHGRSPFGLAEASPLVLNRQRSDASVQRCREDRKAALLSMISIRPARRPPGEPLCSSAGGSPRTIRAEMLHFAMHGMGVRFSAGATHTRDTRIKDIQYP